MSHDGQWFHTVLSALFVLRVAVAVALTRPTRSKRREAPPLEAPKSLIDERLTTVLQEIRKTTNNEGRN